MAFGDFFFGNLRVFQHFLSFLKYPKCLWKTLWIFFFHFYCFSNSRTIERSVMVWLSGTNELCCFCTYPKCHWKYLWKCIYIRILIEIISNLTYLSALEKSVSVSVSYRDFNFSFRTNRPNNHTTFLCSECVSLFPVLNWPRPMSKTQGHHEFSIQK